jgi:hypothetical protein
VSSANDTSEITIGFTVQDKSRFGNGDHSFDQFQEELWSYQQQYAKPASDSKAKDNRQAIADLFELSNGDVDRCKAVHRELQSEPWRKARVDWTVVRDDYGFAEKRQLTEKPGANGGRTLTARDLRELEKSKGGST